MLNNQNLTREGDINISPLREQWLNQLPEQSRVGIESDAAVFIKQSMSTPCLSTIINAEGCYITDANGQKYLDFHGNSLHQVGYKNPYVIEAIKKQIEELPFIPRRFTSNIVIDAAQMLINKTKSKDFKVLFTPSGSAAIGLALKIARKVTGKHKVISMWESFHGAGLDTISVGGEYVFKKDMGPQLPGTLKAIPFNNYRNFLNSSDPEEVASFCLDYMEYIISHESDIGAILLEPIRATDTHIPPKSYFKKLRSLCDKHDILLIFDEIPTALMRTGTFYVHQLFDIEPDILVLGKGLGGGVIPQAAVLTRSKYDCAEDISLGHYTHEKPALGCAAICATIQYIHDFQLEQQVHELSIYINEQLKKLMDQFTCIGDIRIIGLLITIELVTAKNTKEKHDKLAEQLLYYCLQNGLSFKIANGNCITWHPPLIVTKEQVTFAIKLLKKGLEKFHTIHNC